MEKDCSGRTVQQANIDEGRHLDYLESALGQFFVYFRCIHEGNLNREWKGSNLCLHKTTTNSNNFLKNVINASSEPAYIHRKKCLLLKTMN